LINARILRAKYGSAGSQNRSTLDSLITGGSATKTSDASRPRAEKQSVGEHGACRLAGAAINLTFYGTVNVFSIYFQAFLH
jgi:hypothetical protein